MSAVTMRSGRACPRLAAMLCGLAHAAAAGCTPIEPPTQLSAASQTQGSIDAGAPIEASAAGSVSNMAARMQAAAGSNSAATKTTPSTRMQPSASSAEDDAGISTPLSRSAQTPESLPESGSAKRPQLSPPEVLGPLAGPGANANAGLKLFGTDLGYTFVHKRKLTMLFGDSMPNARYYCDTHDPFEDDALATLPLQMPSQGLPELEFFTQPSAADELATLHLLRDDKPQKMGLSQTPVTAWSDGSHALAVMGRLELTTCAAGSTGTDGCDAEAGFTCARNVGRCEPQVADAVAACGPGYPSCAVGQQCNMPKDGYCVDLSSSQYAGTPISVGNAITRNADLAVQRPDAPTLFDVVHTFVSKKFHNPLARAVTRIGPKTGDDDYSPGYGTLLMFGRAGFVAERGGQAQLYLLKHALPMEVNSNKLVFEPEYFTGVDAVSGEPRWSRIQKDAVALAMDGKPNGDPSEPLLVPNVSAISWLPAPINKWIMLYGGDLPDVLILDASVAPETRGAIKVRFADHPWGPWTPREDYYAAGKPDQVGAPYGPGGFLYHNNCRSQDDAKCAATDPVRPLDTYLPGCPTVANQLDIGRMYGLNIIDAYTQPSGAGVDMYWNLSTWNPYGVMLMRTHVEP